MSVSQTSVVIMDDADDKRVEWPLSILKRFNWDTEKGKKGTDVLLIESGANSETGEGTFMFRSKNAHDILLSIKRNIYIAIAKRQQRSSESQGSVRNRTISSTQSEKRFKAILERSRSIASSRGEDVSEQYESDAMSTPPVSPQDQQIELDSEYNKLTLRKSSSERSMDKPKIVAAITLRDETSGNKSHVLFDEEGYSHIPGRVSENNEKLRTLSLSKDSARSTSTSSRDSGVMSTSFETHSGGAETQGNSDETYHDISPLGTEKIQAYVEAYTLCGDPEKLLKDGKLTVENIDTVRDFTIDDGNDEKVLPGVRRKDSPAHIYNDIVHFRQQSSAKETTSEETPEIPRRRSDGDVKNAENEYEDLEKFRKNLTKHLGMDPTIKQPLDIPPALPDRPSSLQIRRKNMHDKKKARKKHMSLIPFRKSHNRAASLSSSSSSASEADDEGENRRHTISNIQTWFIPKSKYNRSQLYPMIDLNVEPLSVSEQNSPSQKTHSFLTQSRPRCSSDTTTSRPNEIKKPLDSDCVYSMPVKVKKQKESKEKSLSIEPENNVDLLTGSSEIGAPPIPMKRVAVSPADVATLVDIGAGAAKSENNKQTTCQPRTIIYEVDDTIGGFKAIDKKSTDQFDPFASTFDPFPTLSKFDSPLQRLGEDITDKENCANDDLLNGDDVSSDKTTEMDNLDVNNSTIKKKCSPQRDENEILFGGNPWNEPGEFTSLSSQPITLQSDDFSAFDPFDFPILNSRHMNQSPDTHSIKESDHVDGEAIYMDMSGKSDNDDQREDVEYVMPSDITS